MRANTVVALGDLAFRFPNEVEPYTPRLYACLRDSSTKVRRHTLMVLTHLILNDMVKVKGQVCEIALCLRDDDPRIRDMCRLLFHELSKRSNNPVYNLLPDIISQLSQLPSRKEDFRSIMSFLLGYIKKEKQNEMLTEKLIQRFPKCTSLSQKADLAYCIAQLKMNEKSIKCLSENFKLYKDALFDDDVKKWLSAVVTKAKKFMKPEMRQFLEEWEAKLNEQAELGAENELAGEKAARAKERASKRGARKKQRASKRVEEIEEDEPEELYFGEEEPSVDKENTPVSVAKQSRGSRRGRRGVNST
jgi:condensin complex subunit 1